MSRDDGDKHGRGARRRTKQRAERDRVAALAWWRKPGVAIFAAALVLAVVGAALALRAAGRVPVEEATMDGVHMRVVQARWLLDQMDHGENFQKPSVMMPDMPQWGMSRVTLEMTLSNRSDSVQPFEGGEFYLVPEYGEPVQPIGATLGRARLEPGQTLNTALQFDFDTTAPHGRLRVEWRHGNDTAYLPIPEPAEHYHLRPRSGQTTLPRDASLLIPLGKAARGADLYASVYGCVACHGDPDVADSNNVGPHLGGIGAAAAARVANRSAAQYLYDSLLEPGAFIAPACKNGPCAKPSGMPEYGSLLTVQNAADLLAYLLSQGT